MSGERSAESSELEGNRQPQDALVATSQRPTDYINFEMMTGAGMQLSEAACLAPFDAKLLDTFDTHKRQIGSQTLRRLFSPFPMAFHFDLYLFS